MSKCSECDCQCGPHEEWTKEQAEKEYLENFPDPRDRVGDRAILCDDCYKEFMNYWDDLGEEHREFGRPIDG